MQLFKLGWPSTARKYERVLGMARREPLDRQSNIGFVLEKMGGTHPLAAVVFGALLASGCSQQRPAGATGEDAALTVTPIQPTRHAPSEAGAPANDRTRDEDAARVAVCEEARRRCSYRFKYADRGDVQVEVRGDFKADGWRAGVVMQRHGSTWTADVDLPFGRDVEYKFFVDGARWIRDPANGATARETDNSRLDAVTCDPYLCVP